MTVLDKSRLPSRHVTEGTHAAPQRAFYYALGLDAEDIHRPLVGVVGAWDGASAAADAPLLIAEAVETGVTAGGMTPRRFATIAGGPPFIARELVADTVELTMRGHGYDALAGVAASPGAIAGLLLAACRLDVPAAVVPLVSPVVGGDVDARALAAAARALGVAGEPAEGDTPAGLAAAGRAAGRLVTERVRAGQAPRALVTAATLREAARAVVAAGAAGDLLAHLVALAHEAGVATTLPALATAAGLGWAAGTLAPAGALVTGASGAIEARARVFDDEPAAHAWLRREGWPEGVALAIRFQGPRGGPGLPRLSAPPAAAPPGALLITDGGAPPLAGVTTIALAAPEAAAGGPLAALRDGDRVRFDGASRIDALDAEGAPTAPPRRALPRCWEKYVLAVGSAHDGAVTHPGAAGERVRYGDL